jgi:hypothetical protein
LALDQRVYVGLAVDDPPMTIRPSQVEARIVIAPAVG